MHTYTSIFRVGLLDDLHNYFPDLLYNSNRFQTVQDVLQYIQGQARTQFNPFEQGQNAYNRYLNNTNLPQNTVVQPPLTQIPVTQVPQDISGSTPVRIRTTTMPPHAPRRRVPISYYFTEDLINNHYDENIIGSTLTNLFNIALNPSSMTDVPIIPTNQQVDSATTLTTNSTAISEPCAICQDAIEVNTRSRRINRCQHTFHQSCIDTWFQSSVTCPICRTDIRGT